MTLLIIYLLFALGVSFLCSLLEAVLLTVNAPYVAALQQEGRPSGDRLLALKSNIDRPLAAILSLNTIAHTAGAAGVGAQAAKLFGNNAVGIASAVMTLLVLVLSEIIPKTLGAKLWRQLAPWVARVLGPLMVAMWPLVQLSRAMSRLIGHEGALPISREEVSAAAELGAEHGVIADDESHILRNVFRFESLAAEYIMTPREVMFALPEREKVGAVLDKLQRRPFSRIPLFGQSLDDVTGYVLRDEILLRAAEDQHDVRLSELRRQIKVVPHTTPLPALFEEMLEQRGHIALVVGAAGETMGVVTVEDVVETLIGLEIVDEVDRVVDMQELARRQWARRARKRGLLLSSGEAYPSSGEPAPHASSTEPAPHASSSEHDPPSA